MTRCTATFYVLFFLMTSGSAKGQFFLDDFEDGDATDGMPVSWVAPAYADAGSREVVDKSFVFNAASREFSMDTDVEGRVYGDVSLRTQFMSAAEDGIGLYVRSTLSGPLGDPSQGQQLWSILEGDGTLAIGRLVEGNIEILDFASVGWDPTGQEVHMQMDLFDGLVTLSAWLDGTDQPNPHSLATICHLPGTW